MLLILINTMPFQPFLRFQIIYIDDLIVFFIEQFIQILVVSSQAILSCQAYYMLFSMRMGFLGYLKCNCPMDKDYRLSLGIFQEFRVDIKSILEETEKMLLKERTMFICDLTIFACPTDDSGWHPRRDSICSESLIGYGEGWMINALRQLQCFVRLGMSSMI